jgi:hypothetical protein
MPSATAISAAGPGTSCGLLAGLCDGVLNDVGEADELDVPATDEGVLELPSLFAISIDSDRTERQIHGAVAFDEIRMIEVAVPERNKNRLSL